MLRIESLPLKTIFMPGDLFAKAEDYSVQPPTLHTPTVRFVRYLTPIITASMRQLRFNFMRL